MIGAVTFSLGEQMTDIDSKIELSDRVKVLFEEARGELAEIGIRPSDRIESVTINTRAKKRLGCCKANGSGMSVKYRIEISQVCEDLDDHELKTIILHELLHTCPGCMNHGVRWKKAVMQVNTKLGYDISSTADYSKLGLVPAGERAPYRYKVTCCKCGQSMYRYNRSKLVQRPWLYRCANCGGKLTVERV